MKNRPPNVFVSSTMYDLSELRAQLGQFVEGLGWRAVMSEHDSFPIDPDQTTVENSRRNVRENADIVVMVIGARYGSIDAEADKSVTNLEFVEARARGVPAYVFVSRDVLAQLRVWKANPEADYSSVVDTPRIFEFVDSFRRGGEAWTFEFATAKDIVDALRQQFAYLVQDALELRQMARGQDRLVAELEGDSLMVALQRDENWEIRDTLIKPAYLLRCLRDMYGMRRWRGERDGRGNVRGVVLRPEEANDSPGAFSGTARPACSVDTT